MSAEYDVQPDPKAAHTPSGQHRSVFRLKLLLAAVAALGVASVCVASGRESTTPDFTKAMNGAMDRMMMAMDVNPSGDVDRDFVATMVPHHQGAIDMAIAELRFGKDEKLKRIAQEIIVDQQQEIAAMHLALGQPLPPSAPAPTGTGHHSAMQMEQ